MIKHLSNITDLTVLDQNPRDNIIKVSRIDFESDPLGAGSFGTIHKVTSIDGVQKDEYVLKIILADQHKKHAYEVINLLHEKIKKHQAKSKLPIYHEYPELLGLPFLGFKGYDVVSDQHCVAFLMYNMSFLGYDDYGSDYTNDNHRKCSFPDRLFLAYQLSKVIHFLHSNDFVHSDFSEHSIFIDYSRIQVSLIDFDGGFHYDTQKKPSTIGKISQWISGKFSNIIRNQEGPSDRSIEERIGEEYWVLANAIFEIVFGVTPFFFLTEADDIIKKSYLKEFDWPKINYTSDLLNKNNIELHTRILESLVQLEQSSANELVKAFKIIFNKGYSNEKKRLSALEWKKTLRAIIYEGDYKPKILDYNCNKKHINRKDENIQLQWACKKYDSLYVNDKLVNIHTSSLILSLPDETDLVLRAINDFEKVEETIVVKANKVDPQIIHFTASKHLRETEEPVKLSWSTRNATQVFISGNETELPSEGELEVSPTEKTEYILKAIGYFGEEFTKTITIDILRPKIKRFDYEINLNEGIDNIDLIWQTDDSIRVTIQPRVGEVDLNGNTHIRIREKTIFTLVAESQFAAVTHTIEAHPFPVPIINQIFVESPAIELNINFAFKGEGIIEQKLIEDFNSSMKTIEIKCSLDQSLIDETVIPFIRFEGALLKNHVPDIHIESIWEKLQKNYIKRKIYRSMVEKIANNLNTKTNA